MIKDIEVNTNNPSTKMIYVGKLQFTYSEDTQNDTCSYVIRENGHIVKAVTNKALKEAKNFSSTIIKELDLLNPAPDDMLVGLAERFKEERKELEILLKSLVDKK